MLKSLGRFDQKIQTLEMNELIIKQQQQQRWKHLKTFDATKVDTKRFQLEFLACDYYWEPL